MKEKNFETILYSSAGVAAMFVLLLAFYVVTSEFKERVDLTAEKAYTLSPGTRHILAKLDAPVTLRFYCSQETMPPGLKPFTQEIEDLLEEYQQAGKGKIILQKMDPKPDSDAEDSARLDGIQGQAVQMGGDRIYLGLAVSRMDEKVAIPSWLDMSRERLLEYDISRAITRVVNPAPVTIGVMSALPIFGAEPNPMMGMNQQPPQPWVFVTELKKDFTVTEVPMTADKIDPEIKVLLVFHPRDITEETQYAIDQFIMRGGKVVAFLDPHAYFDPKHDQMAQVLGESSGQSSLPLLLRAWGLEMDNSKVVADLNACMRNPQGGPIPTVLLLTKDGVNKDDIVTAQIDNMEFAFCGAFTGKPAEGLQETTLAHSSTNSEMVEGITASVGSDQIVKDFKASGIKYDLAVRLTGKFKTAFPGGRPKAANADTNAPKPPVEESLKESPANSAVVLVADIDCLADQICVRVMEPIPGYRIAQPQNGNLNFAESCIEQMAGDSDLITLRSRGSLNRPFTRLQELEANAGKQWQAKLKDLEANRETTEQKISALQASKQGGAQQQMLLSPQQQAELENYRKTEAATQKELRQVQKNLKKDTDSLESEIKFINIGAMPALVAVTGVVLSVVKRKRTAAK